MGQIGLQPTGGLGQASPGIAQSYIRPNRAFVLIPVGGLLVFIAAISVYRPLDRTLFFILGFLLFFAAVFLISHVQQKSRRGEDVSSFFPMTYWLAFSPAILGFVLWANGAMDHSVVETHRQLVTRKFISHGRHSVSYHIEFTSWRAKRTTEQAEVSHQQYAQLHMDDPIIVELHKGALGIAWLGKIQKTD
jgi:hypothetical protein